MTTGCKLTRDDKFLKTDTSHYRSMIGRLLYLTATRLDIMYALNLPSRFQQELKESHVVAVKKIFRYLKGTEKFGLHYPRNLDFNLTTYTDVDWDDNVDDKKKNKWRSVLSWLPVSHLVKKKSRFSVPVHGRSKVHYNIFLLHSYFMDEIDFEGQWCEF